MMRRKGREITGVHPQSLQDPKMGGSRLAKMADEEEELGTSGHEVEHKPSFWRVLRVFFRKVWDAKEGTPLNSPPPWQGPAKPLTATSALLGEEELHKLPQILLWCPLVDLGPWESREGPENDPALSRTRHHHGRDLQAAMPPQMLPQYRYDQYPR